MQDANNLILTEVRLMAKNIKVILGILEAFLVIALLNLVAQIIITYKHSI